MQVEDALPGLGADVRHDPVPTRDARIGRDGADGPKHVSQEVTIGIGQGVGVGNVVARNDEHVGRCLRVDVSEGDDLLVGEHDLRRNLARHDAAEQAVQFRLHHPRAAYAKSPDRYKRMSRQATLTVVWAAPKMCAVLSVTPIRVVPIVVVIALTACVHAARPRTPAPLPSGATAVELQTTPAASEYVENWACPAALLNPIRVRRDGDAIAFDTLDGTPVHLVWPRGFSARLFDNRIEIVAPDGTLIARDGDVLDGLVGGADPICEVNGVTYPPAS